MKTSKLVLLVMSSLGLFGCNAEDLTAPAPALPKAPSSAQSLLPFTDHPYEYFPAGECWVNHVKTNGAAFGLANNTGYLCHTTDLSVAENERDIWIGFYQDGTVSVRRKNNADYVFAVDAINFSHTADANCMLHLRDVNDPSSLYIDLSMGPYNGDFDSDGYPDSIWHSYYTDPHVASHEDSTIECTIQPHFGG